MRYALAVWIVVAVAGLALAQSRLSPREISDMVREYGLSGTRDDRRTEIVRALEGAPENRTTSPLKKLAKDDPARAAQLAVALRHPKTWQIVSGSLAGDEERDVLTTLFPDPPGDCREELIKRWEKIEAGSPSFELLTDLYVEYPELSALEVDVFARALRDSERRYGAGRVMHALLGLQVAEDGGRPDPDEVRQHWETVERTWREQARVFRTTGEPIIPRCERREGAIEMRGPNRLLGPEAVLAFGRLDPWQARNHDVIVRFLPLTPDGFNIGNQVQVNAKDGAAWTLEAHGGQVSIKTGQGGEASAPFTVGAWNEARFSLEMIEGPLAKQRTIKIYVNGKQLAEGQPLGHHGDLKFIFFQAKGGRVVIAGAEIVGR